MNAITMMKNVTTKKINAIVKIITGITETMNAIVRQ